MPLSRVNSRKFCEPIGCRVTQVARSGILPKEDDDTIVLIEAALREDGVRLLTHTRTLRCEAVHEEQRLVVTSGPSAHPDQSSGGAEEALPFNLLLCAIGRRARETGFGLEALGIPPPPPARSRPTPICRPAIRKSWPAATWSALISSLM